MMPSPAGAGRLESSGQWADDLLLAVLRPIRAGDAFEVTVDHLATAIRLGVFPRGAALPPERELAARLGVARVTLREAIAALREARLVQTRRGRGGGSVVVYDGVERVITRCDDGSDAEAYLPRGQELDALLAYRRIIEPGAAALAASIGLRAPHRTALVAALAAMAEASDPGTRRVAESRLHVTIAQLTGCAPLLDAVVRTRGVVHRLLAASALPAGSDGSDGSGGSNREWHAEHTALVDAVLAGEVDAARRASERQCDRTADLLRAAS